MVERLQVKASSIGRILNNLEKKYNGTYEKDDRDMKKSTSGQQLGHPPKPRAPDKIQRIPAFNPNKIRKSPSTEPAADGVVAVAQEDLTEVTEAAEKSEE